MDIPNELRRGIGWDTPDHPPPPHKTPAATDPTVPDLGDLADRINAACHAAELALADGFTRAIAAGELLVEAKLKTGHGQWLPWLKSNTRVPPRTAQLYMRLAQSRKEIEAKAQDLAYLTIDQAVKLIAAPKDDAKPAGKAEKATKPELVAARMVVEPSLFPADPPPVPVAPPPVVIDVEAVEVTPPEPKAVADPLPEPTPLVSETEVTAAVPATVSFTLADVDTEDLLSELRQRIDAMPNPASAWMAARLPDTWEKWLAPKAEEPAKPKTLKRNEPDERRDRVNAHLKAKGIEKSAFAAICGAPAASVRNWLNGYQPLNEKYHAAVDAALGAEG